jgi:hypothetical protein
MFSIFLESLLKLELRQIYPQTSPNVSKDFFADNASSEKHIPPHLLILNFLNTIRLCLQAAFKTESNSQSF